VYWLLNPCYPVILMLRCTRHLNNLKLNNLTLHKQVPQIENLTSPLSFYNSPAILLPYIYLHSFSPSVHSNYDDDDHINFARNQRFGLVNIGQRKVTGDTTLRRKQGSSSSVIPTIHDTSCTWPLSKL
jgi:hypothetical protein